MDHYPFAQVKENSAGQIELEDLNAIKKNQVLECKEGFFKEKENVHICFSF